MGVFAVKAEGWNLFQPYSAVTHAHFGNTFLDSMCNQIYFLTFYYISDIQKVFLAIIVKIFLLFSFIEAIQKKTVAI